MTLAAFQGFYSDLRFVKTRSVAVISVEIPIEQASAFVAAFGAPTPGAEIPVAIARIDPTKAAGEAPKPASEPNERRRFHDLPLPQQAAMRCNEPAFRRFLAEREDVQGIAMMDLDMAAETVREICCVQSRSEISDSAINNSGIRWRELEADYTEWMRPV